MSRRAVNAKGAAAFGPYSHAVRAAGLVFCSGQTPLDPATGQLVESDVAAQTRQCFANLFHVLAEIGLSADDVATVQVYLVDMNDFAAMNEVHAPL